MADSTPPTASLSPFSNQLVKGNINVTGNVNDDNLYIYNISFVRVSDSYTVKQVAGRNNVSSDTLSIVNTLTLPDDIYNVTMRAEDFWGNEITSNTIQITVDNTAPSSFALNTPTNLSYTTNPRPAFTWDASSDIHGITYDIIANSGNLATNLVLNCRMCQ